MNILHSHSLVAAAACLLAAGFASAKEPIFVAVDDASLATVGPMPVDRTVYAQAIETASKLGAKAVVLKFFLPTPKSAGTDDVLAAAIAHGNVLMQVEATTGPGREPTAPFVREGWSFQGIGSPFEIGNVDPPLQMLERGARALGFVSVRPGFDKTVEVVGRWHQKAVPSLQLAAVELAMGESAKLEGKNLRVGKHHVQLDDMGRMPCDVTHAPALARYGIDQLLNEQIPRSAIEGRVVVLGYDRKDSPTVSLGGPKIGVHEAFNRQVSCLYTALTK